MTEARHSDFKTDAKRDFQNYKLRLPQRRDGCIKGTSLLFSWLPLKFKQVNITIFIVRLCTLMTAGRIAPDRNRKQNKLQRKALFSASYFVNQKPNLLSL